MGQRSAGADPIGDLRLSRHSEVSSRLLDALPAVTVVRADEWDSPLVALLSAEAGYEGAGQEANLAAAVSCSRAVFARRFTEQVGEPPIAFLTSWRLALAADLLQTSDKTIAAVAKQVGYSTPFALSSAFKRAYGISPNTHRARGVRPDGELHSSAF